MEVDIDDSRPADTMEEIISTHVVAKEAERIIDPSSTLPLVPASSPLEEGQISPQHSSAPTTSSRDEEVQALPFSFMEPNNVLESSTQNMETPTTSVPHCQEPRKPDEGKANAVDPNWVSGWGNDGWGTPTAVVVANQDMAPLNQTGKNGKGEERCDNWDSGWSPNNRASSTASHATISPPAISGSALPATTTIETTNAASVNSLQETPQPNQSTAEKSATIGWASWEANNGWSSPGPAGAGASERSAPQMPTGGNEGWGPPPRSPTSMPAASTSVQGGTGGWDLMATSRGRFEDKSEGNFERGRGRGRGGGRGRNRAFGGSGRRVDLSSGDQPPAKSFNQSSTSFGNPDSGWTTRPRENNRTIETSPTRGHRQESTQATWGSNIPAPPIHQAQPSMESQVYQTPLSPAPPVTVRSVLWPLHTDLRLKRDFSRHTSEIAKCQAQLTELEIKRKHVHSWYISKANDINQLHKDDRETREQERNKARLKRDDNLAALKVEEKKYAGSADVEWMLLVQMLTEEMARTLESGVHELLWKMTAAAGDGNRGFDINRALEEIVKTAIPSIIKRPLQQYAEAIVKATEKESRKVEAAALLEDHPMKEQSDTKQVSSLDLQGILERLSALEQENVKLQEAVQQLDAKTQEKVSSVRTEALGWTLDGNDHPVAQQIREKFQAERTFIIDGITSNVQLAFEGILDRHSPGV